MAEKGGYKHFMLKEIMEQKSAISNAVSQTDEEIKKFASVINKIRQTKLKRLYRSRIQSIL